MSTGSVILINFVFWVFVLGLDAVGRRIGNREDK